MTIVAVSDTNIFIDLLETSLLEKLFLLPWKIHTTDFILNEIKEERQKKQMDAIKHQYELTVKVFDIDELADLLDFYEEQRSKSNLSLQDCSVWTYSKNNGFALITGDGKLRIAAKADGVEVHGILYIFDQFVEHKILTSKEAADKLEELKLLNQRLPKSDIDKRIDKWRGSHINEKEGMDMHKKI